MSTFDPNGVGVKGSLFGLPYDTESADIIVIPVPWDVTVSYGEGTAEGPKAILEASSQIDYEIPGRDHLWETKVAMAEIPEVWYALGKKLRTSAKQYIDWLEEGSPEEVKQAMMSLLDEVNEQCAQLTKYVQQQTAYWRGRSKQTILLGGDHSTPLGHINAYANEFADLGILQIDAHADLRVAYEGFQYSHASIMDNVMRQTNVQKLVQVGVRDYCETEGGYISSSSKITTFFDETLKREQFDGKLWSEQCRQIIEELPTNIYLSVDIDGLNPSLCPSTGTPVPGGLSFNELTYLIDQIKASAKKIVSADLVEVSPEPTEWDANVGARVLWRLVNALESN